MRAYGRRAGAAAAAVAACIALTLTARAAGGVQSADPWWFQDQYTSLAYVDPAATTATVDTSAGATGQVSLPLVPAGLALDPAAATGLIATAAGVQAWSFDGAALAPAPVFDLPAADYVGAAWLGAAGNQLALATPGAVMLDAWSGAAWRQVGRVGVGGVAGIAQGAPFPGAAATILVATNTGFQVAAYRGGALALVSGAGITGLQGVGGIAAAPGGALAALWSGSGLRVYGWDGSAYRQAPTWEIPAGGPAILGAAWFRGGNGYWVLRADGTLSAYAFDGSFVVAVPGLSARIALPVAALATGWGRGAVAALCPSGWTYLDGDPLGPDAARSLNGLHLPLYQPSAVLQSIALQPGHALDAIQVDAAVATEPVGTGIAYQVSTDGGASWTRVSPCLNPGPPADCAADNTALPPGSDILYRLVLSTANPDLTPRVDTTSLFEIATETETVAGARAVLIR